MASINAKHIRLFFILFVLCSAVASTKVKKRVKPNPGLSSSDEAETIYQKVKQYIDKGQNVDALHYMTEIENAYGTLALPYTSRPSLYSYRGLAFAGTGINDQIHAVEAFHNATIHTPSDIYAWMNLGEVSMQTFQLLKAIEVFEHVRNVLGFEIATAKLVRAMAWTARWYDFVCSCCCLPIC